MHLLSLLLEKKTYGPRENEEITLHFKTLIASFFVFPREIEFKKFAAVGYLEWKCKESLFPKHSDQDGFVLFLYCDFPKYQWMPLYSPVCRFFPLPFLDFFFFKLAFIWDESAFSSFL